MPIGCTSSVKDELHSSCEHGPIFPEGHRLECGAGRENQITSLRNVITRSGAEQVSARVKSK